MHAESNIDRSQYFLLCDHNWYFNNPANSIVQSVGRSLFDGLIFLFIMLGHRVLFKRRLSPFIQVIWSGQVYRAIQLTGVILLR